MPVAQKRERHTAISEGNTGAAHRPAATAVAASLREARQRDLF